MVSHTTIYIVLEGVNHMNIQILKWLTIQLSTLCLKVLSI